MSIRLLFKTIGLNKKYCFLDGQSLIEILIAIGLTSVLLPALLTGLVASREGKAQEGQRLEATALLKGAEEAVRSVYGSSWNNVAVNGTYYPEISGSYWVLTSCGGSCPTINGYTRQLVISDVYRDSGFNVVTSGGTLDPSTKKVEISVSWNTPRVSSVSTTEYLERYLDNASKIHTTQADFNGGSHNNTQTVATGGGAVELTQSTSTGADYGNKFRVLATPSIGAMTTSGHKTSMRFTAQEQKTVTSIRVYLSQEQGNSPSYTYGLQADSSGNPSGVFLSSNTIKATSTGWQTITLLSPVSVTAGTIYHLVVEPSGAPAANAYINVASTSILNYLIVKTQTTDPNSNTLFKAGASASWSQKNQQPIYELDYFDTTYEGNPFFGSQITTIQGKVWAGEKFTVTDGDKTVTAITFYVSRNAPGTPLDSLWVELRNVATDEIIEDGPMPFLPIPPTSTYVTKTYTFSTQQVLTNGSTYRIILKSPLSTASNAYLVYRLVGQNTANFNSITYDGTNSVYTVSGNAGSTWTDKNLNMDIAGFWFTVQGGTTYPASGDFTSHSSGGFDAGVNNAAFNNITWTALKPANTDLTLQVAISNNSGGPWDYFGADGSLGSFFTVPAPIPLNRINGRYVRYKAIFTGNGSVTPTLADVSINYSP